MGNNQQKEVPITISDISKEMETAFYVREDDDICIYRVKLERLLKFCKQQSEAKREITIQPKIFEETAEYLKKLLNIKKKETRTLTVPVLEKPVLEIMVADPQPSGATEKFLKSFSQWLDGSNIKLNQVSPEVLEEMQDKTPVFLVCNNHSRLVADIKNTTMGMKRELFGHMVLVILHMKKEKHLPKVSTKEQLADTNDFQNFKAIIDVAFDKDAEPGMYDCEMNEIARNVIETIFRR